MKKNCKDCGKPRDHNNALISRCKSCHYKKQQEKPKKIYTLKKTPLKKFGKKRIERIKTRGSEYDVFVDIWLTRVNDQGERICENCGKPIKLFHTSCFAHKIAKSKDDDLRLEKDNIALVHGIFEIKNTDTGQTYQCHDEYDAKFRKANKM